MPRGAVPAAARHRREEQSAGTYSDWPGGNRDRPFTVRRRGGSAPSPRIDVLRSTAAPPAARQAPGALRPASGQPTRDHHSLTWMCPFSAGGELDFEPVEDWLTQGADARFAEVIDGGNEVRL